VSPATDAVKTPPPLSRRRDDCRLCQSRDLVKVLSLAPSPPANAFVGPDDLDRDQVLFPLDLWLCARCSHLQLLDVVDPASLFRDYVYASGTSPVFVAHFDSYADYVVTGFQLRPDDLAVDIGSNDGTLLRAFQRAGLRTLGVDPALDIARRATESGVETIPSFFTPELAGEMRSRYGAARAVTANNVFAHVDDLSAMVRGVRTLLAPGGVFALEVSYLVDVLEKTLFDTIYHEHLDYHSVGPLVPFFARHDLELIDAVRVDSHGGSLRAIVQHQGGPRPVGGTVSRLLALEEGLGLGRPETYRAFGTRVDDLGRELLDLLHRVKAEGARVAAFGAPAKATTLMHHFGIGPEVVDFVVDDSPLKQGLYTPGFHVPVLPSSAIYERRPDYVVILAWNFAPSIARTHQRFVDEGGRFIVPLPRLEVW
jgi:SAM-dependent methyltransferase